jgi:hypothetical protein
MNKYQTGILDDLINLKPIPFDESLNQKDGMVIDSIDLATGAEILITFFAFLLAAMFQGILDQTQL